MVYMNLLGLAVIGPALIQSGEGKRINGSQSDGKEDRGSVSDQ